MSVRINDKVKIDKLITIMDKRFFPEVGKVYEVHEWYNARPLIKEGNKEVLLQEGEFTKVVE